MRRSGVQLRSNRESHLKHTLNHEALDELTPEAAYWCGFLFADGSVSRIGSKTPEVSLSLSACDRGQIEKLRVFLGSTHAIVTYTPKPAAYQSRPVCRFSVRSHRLADRLCELGRYEGDIDSDLAQSRDFWRGMVDGDGTFGIYSGFASFALVGSRQHLGQFLNFTGRIGRRALTVHPSKTTHEVRASYRTAEVIVRRLYRDASLALDRKASRAAAIMKWADSPQKPLPGFELLGL